MSQTQYAKDILDRAGMAECKPLTTPVDLKSKLYADDEDPVPDPTAYRSLTGALQYLTFTRPDISYAVHQICLYMHCPRQPHFQALRCILRYIKGTIYDGIKLTKGKIDGPVAYSDADWGGCPDTRRSTSGYCVFLGPTLISWSAKRQPTVSRSISEAEYKGVANTVSELCWIRNLMLELGWRTEKVSIVYCDNISSFTLLQILSSTSAQNILNLTFTLSEKKLHSARSRLFMFLHHSNMLIYSLKGYRLLYLMSSRPA